MGLFDSIGEFGSETAANSVVALGLDAGPLKRDLGKVAPEMEHAASGWGKAFKLASIGLGVFAAGFLGFVADGIKQADELDAALARVGTQTGMTGAQIAKMRKGILDISTRTPHGIDALAKSIEQVAKAGYSVDDSLRIQEAAAKAATITHADLAGVTSTVVTAMKAWNIAGKDVNKVTDTLLTTVGRSRIDWESLSRIIATAAPIAKDAGVSFADLNAAIIAVGRSGLPARRAASGVITLIRSLSSPAAQKQMAALGITVNATTIKHDGLLKTLQKLEAASHKHISVIVKTKGVHVDLTKATEQLRVAELRLNELQKKKHVTASTMLAAENRVADARRRITELQAKETAGGIDYAKSIEATKKANVGSLELMKAMVGGASGLVTADILLGNGARDFKAGQDALNHSLGQTAEQFRAVMEADIGAQITLIKNKVTTLAVELGTMLLPYVAQFVHFMADAIPKALTGIGDLWNTYLKAPVTAMVSSFLGFASALNEVLFNWGTGSSGANNIKGFFQTLAGIMGTLATDLGTVFDVLKTLLNLPGVGVIAKLAEGFIALRLAITGIPALVRAMLGGAGGTLRALTGGLIGGGAAAEGGNVESSAGSVASATGGNAALERSAEELGSAAGELGSAAGELGEVSGEFDAVIEAENKAAEATLKAAEATTKGAESLIEAATATKESSLAQKEGGLAEAVGGESGFNAAEAIRNQTYVESTIAANESTIKANASTERTNVQTVDADDATLKADDAGIGAAAASKEASSATAKAMAASMEASASSKIASDAQIAASKAQIEGALAQKEGALASKEGALAGAEGAAGGLLGKAGAAKGAIGGLLGKGVGLIGGLISKAIVPLLIAQIATDILKAPIGDFVSSQFGLHNVGTKMREDFFGGAVDWFRTIIEAGGSDAWVGKAEDTRVGNASFKTINLAKLGIDSATIDELQAPEGTILHAQGEFKAIPVLTNDLAQHASEAVLSWYDRIRTQLPEDVAKQAASLVGDLHDRGKHTEAVKKLTALLASATASQLSGLTTKTQDDYLTALEPALKAQGFTAGQIRSLNLAQLANVGNIMANDTTGQYKAVVDFLIHTYLGEFAKNTTAQGQLVTAEQQAQISTLAKKLGVSGNNLMGGIRDVLLDPKKGVFSQVGRSFVLRKGANPVIVKELSAAFGAEWQATTAALLKSSLKPSRTGKVTGIYGSTADQEKVLKQAALSQQHAVEDYYKTVPRNIQDALEAFIASEPTRLPPATLAALKHRFGDDWLIAFKDGTTGIGPGKLDPAIAARMKGALGKSWQSILSSVTEGKANLGLNPATVAKLKAEFGSGWQSVVKSAATATVDKDIAAKMQAAFGPHWREALQTFGSLLFQKEGGADTIALRNALAASVRKTVAGMNLSDLGPPTELTAAQKKQLAKYGETPEMTPTQASAARKAIQKVMDSIPAATLASLGSPDAKEAKKAMEDVGKKLAKVLPPDKASQLLGVLSSLATDANTKLPNALDTLQSAMGPVGGQLGQVANAIDVLSAAAGRFIRAHPEIVSGGGGEGTQGNRRTGSTRAAAGINLTTQGETNITAGEAGTEQVVVVSGPRRLSLRQLFAKPSEETPKPPPATPPRPAPTPAPVALRVAPARARPANAAPSPAPSVLSFLRQMVAAPATAPAAPIRVPPPQTILRNLANPGRAALSGLAARPAPLPARGPSVTEKAKQAVQQLFVDHMHIQSKPDETSILETLEFMAPGGIG